MILFFIFSVLHLGSANKILCYTGSAQDPVKECSSKPTGSCPSGYRNIKVGEESVCFKVTQSSNWESAVSRCRDPLISDNTSEYEKAFRFEEWLRAIEQILQKNYTAERAFWLPARRHFEGAPIYDHLTFKPPQNFTTEKELQGAGNSLSLDHRKCLLLKQSKPRNEISTVDCNEIHYGMCLYRHHSEQDKIKTKNCKVINSYILRVGDPVTHSCPKGWETHRLIPGRNRCFKIFNSTETSWKQAAARCIDEGGQLATLERYDLYSIVYNLKRSSGIFGHSWVGLTRVNQSSPVFCWVNFTNSMCLPTVFAPFQLLPQSDCQVKSEDIYGALDTNGFLSLMDDSVRTSSYICEKRIQVKAKHRLQLTVDQGQREVVRVRLVNPNFSTGSKDDCELKADSIRFQGQTCEKGIRCYRNGVLVPLNYQLSDGSYELDSSDQPSFYKPSFYSCEYWFEPELRLITSNVTTRNFERTYSVRLKLNMSDWNSDDSDAKFFQDMAITRIRNTYCPVFSCKPFPFSPEFVNILTVTGELYVNILVTADKGIRISNSLVSNCERRSGLTNVFCLLRSAFLGNSFNHKFSYELKEEEYTIARPIRSRVNCETQTTAGGKMKYKVSNREHIVPPSVTYTCTRSETFTGIHVLPSFGCPEINETDGTGEEYRFPEASIHKVVTELDLCGSRTVKYKKKCEGSEVYGAIWDMREEITDMGLDTFCPANGDDQTILQLKSIWEEMTNRSTANTTQILEIIRVWNPSVNHVHLLASILQKIKSIDADGLTDGFKILSKVMEIDDHLFAVCQKLFNLAKVCSDFEGTLKDSISLADTIQDQFTYVCSTLAHATVVPNENITIRGYAIAANNKTITNATLTSNYEVPPGKDGLIFIPESLSLSDVISFTAYADAVLFDSDPDLDVMPVYEYDLTNQNYVLVSNATADTIVLEADIPGKVILNLNDPVKLMYKQSEVHKRRNDVCNDTEIICVYWNPTINGIGGWATDGCIYNKTEVSSGEVYDVCLCNHLTSFTRLIPDRKICGTHGIVLDWISSIGSLLSIASLCLVILNFLVYKPWKKHIGVRILVNLSIALLFALILIQVSFHGKTVELVVPFYCTLVVPFLHYFLLVSFMWMLVEAYHQYEKFVYILPNYVPRFMTKARIISWGLPVLPVIIGLIYEHEYPLTYFAPGDTCWMEMKIFLFTVLSPWIIIMGINIGVYILFLKNAIFYSSNLRQTSHTMLASKIRASLFLFTILGLSWSFGIFTLLDHSLTCAYLFSLFSSFQGVFIFVFTVAQDVEVILFWALKFGFPVEKLLHLRMFRNVSSQFSRFATANPSKSSGKPLKSTSQISSSSSV